MKYTFAILVFIFHILIGTACDSESLIPKVDVEDGIDETNDPMKTTITITVGDKKFLAMLLDNASATSLKAMLPLTTRMTELNGNEKYFRLSKNLPTNTSNPETIHSGDLMLWGSNTFVVFYETFSTSYDYTKLGKIDDPAGLEDALGSGNVTITIELL